MRSIGVVSVGRTDWTIWRPILDEIRNHPTLELRLYATGMHLSPEFGMTVKDVLDDGFEVSERIEMLLSSDSPQGVAKAIGMGILGFAQVFDRSCPDVLVVVGDRFETLAAVTAAVPFRIPVAHIHGGESTEGAIDELMRHAITKMSHLHFASTQLYAERIRQMGEESWRVFATGAPAIDSIKRTRPLSRHELADKFGIDPDQPFLLVTYHPVTLEHEATALQVNNLLCALEQFSAQIIFTYPNADMGGRIVMALMKDFEASHRGAKLLSNMGLIGYTSAMSHAAAMVGNSSSGIIEAASFELPVVNIGNRQQARLRPNNVIDVHYDTPAIVEGIREAHSPKFKDGLRGIKNPYGDGTASRKIVQVLLETKLDQRLLVKKFVDERPSVT